MPSRRDIDPAAIVPALPIVFICDYERHAGRMRFRLAGEDIRSAYPCDVRGRFQDEFFAEEDRPAHLERIRLFAETPAILYAAGEIYGFSGRAGTGERLALPLADDGKTTDGVIGATAYRWNGAGLDDRPVRQQLVVTFAPLDGAEPWSEPGVIAAA